MSALSSDVGLRLSLPPDEDLSAWEAPARLHGVVLVSPDTADVRVVVDGAGWVVTVGGRVIRVPGPTTMVDREGLLSLATSLAEASPGRPAPVASTPQPGVARRPPRPPAVPAPPLPSPATTTPPSPSMASTPPPLERAPPPAMVGDALPVGAVVVSGVSVPAERTERPARLGAEVWLAPGLTWRTDSGLVPDGRAAVALTRGPFGVAVVGAVGAPRGIPVLGEDTTVESVELRARLTVAAAGPVVPVGAVELGVALRTWRDGGVSVARTQDPVGGLRGGVRVRREGVFVEVTAGGAWDLVATTVTRAGGTPHPWPAGAADLEVAVGFAWP